MRGLLAGIEFLSFARHMEEHTPIVLTDAERARIGQRASQGLIRALVAQAGMAVFAVVLSGLVGGGVGVGPFTGLG